MHLIGAETVEDEFDTHAASTADFEGEPAAHRAAHLQKFRRLVAPLDRRPYGVVDQGLLDQIHAHGSLGL